MCSDTTERHKNRPAGNYVLTGLMGTGKTTIGKRVAAILKRDFIDTDEYLEQSFGAASTILNQPDGDHQFQLIEEKIAKILARKTDHVIATGGRFFLNQNNIDALVKSSRIICLTADSRELVSRLLNNSSDTFRPRFTKAGNKLRLMETLARQSASYYQQFDQFDTTGKPVEEVAVKVAALFEKSH